MNKNNIILAALLGLAFIVGSYFIGSGFKRSNHEYISVTGMAEQSFESDLFQFRGDYSVKGSELSQAYQEIKRQTTIVQNYFTNKGLKADEITLGTISIDRDYNYERDANGYGRNVFNGFTARQYISIKSKRLDIAEKIAKESMELVEKGVEFQAGNPQFSYTKLNDLKLDIIDKASTNAKERAVKIATAAGNNLGKLKKASLGVFQITGEDAEEEEYSWGGVFNTSSRKKKARVTVTASYHAN